MNMRSGIQVYALLVVVACTRSAVPVTTPLSPGETVRQFLAAAQANDLRTMGHFWGSEQGLTSERLDLDALQKRLQIMQVYLDHEHAELIPNDRPVISDNAHERTIRVRLVRRGCTFEVPFTLREYRGGWLVYDVDLLSLGNPARSCR